MRGSVRNDGNSWYVTYDAGIDPVAGKRKQKKKRGFKTKKEAEKFLTEQLNSLDKGIYFEPTKMTFGEYLDYWLLNYAKHNTSARTYEGYNYMINTHIKHSLGSVELTKLFPLHLQDYYSKQLSEGRKDGLGGLSAQSVRHHHRVISKALNDAVKWQFVIRNVAEAVDAPKPKKHEMKTLNAIQVNELLAIAKHSQYYPVIFTAIYTGMRRGEILGLRWKDIDFENRLIYVRQSLQSVTGRGIIYKEPKSGKGRSISITDTLIQMLKKHKVEQNKNKLMLGESYEDQDLVFAQNNGKPFQPPELTRSYNKLVKKAGLPPVRFHDLRHTHATLMLQQGIHPKIVSERLGHSTIGITLDTYTHVLPNMQKEAAEKLEKLINVK